MIKRTIILSCFFCFIWSIATCFSATAIPVGKNTDEDRISFNFQSIPVRTALQLLAKFAKINLVVNDSVEGTITISLHNLPWEQALDVILKSRSLAKQKLDNTYIIAPAAELLQDQQEQLKTQQEIQKFEPLKSELIQIKYSKATDIAALLKNGNQGLLSERGTVTADVRTNILWIQDIPEKIREIQQLISTLDTPTRQVLIEARIVNIDKNYMQQLGIRWGSSTNLTDANLLQNESLPYRKNYLRRLNIDLPAQNVGQMGGAASVGLALAKLGSSTMLDLELSALQTEGGAKIISSPRLITANQQPAEILSGEEIPYQEATVSGATAVAFKKAVLSLKVTPQITADNRIVLNLVVNQDKPGAEVLLGVPTIDTRQVQTQVLVNNGQTLVLGGIFQNNSSDTITRVPFLSDIPILGHLFRYKSKQNRQTELLIFVTPKLIKQSLLQ